MRERERALELTKEKKLEKKTKKLEKLRKKGFTEWARAQAGKLFYDDPRAKLTKPQEVGAGIVGGVLACWNHPIGEFGEGKRERERERERES